MKRRFNPSTAVLPCPVILLSVAGSERPNIITISWVANVCSAPPTVVVGIRPTRHSHGLVTETGDFVVNIPSEEQLEKAVLCGTRSGRDHDKFTECGFTAVPGTKVKSPLIRECPVNIECVVQQTMKLGVHDLFIAEVVAVHIAESMLDERGRLDVSKLKPFTYVPLTGHYWSLGSLLK